MRYIPAFEFENVIQTTSLSEVLKIWTTVGGYEARCFELFPTLETIQDAQKLLGF